MLPHYSDATIWGPQGDPNQERARLKPGDRLQDGRIFAGDDPEARLVAALGQVDALLQPLIAQRNKILEKLTELSPEKYGEIILGVEDETDLPTALLQAEEHEELTQDEVARRGQTLLIEATEVQLPAELEPFVESSEETQAAFEPFMDAPVFTEAVDLPFTDPPPAEEVTLTQDFVLPSKSRRPKKNQQ